ncbi:MAG: MBOAT family O-acyltransferase [Bdellovibrionota bacterium]
MAFSSVLFLFGFLPIFFVAYYALPNRYRNAWALIGSGLFYAWGAPAFLGVALVTSFVDFRISHRIADNTLPAPRRKLLLAVAIALNLAILFYFKYSNFFVGQVNGLLESLGRADFNWVDVALPIGISFITFEKISYLVDVYRGIVRPAPTFSTYLLFLALFPHLIAGPIFRYHDISEQLLERKHSWESMYEGMVRFSFGLAKKTLLADPLAEVVNRIFHLSFVALTPGYAWLGAICYAFQIFYDFSGYSDMAIGLGKMMGFTFLENFNRPYISTSITEFWRRWHISLSNWMREYLYIPLGGNRGSVSRTYLNLWIVFLLSGLWHGANWTFVIWGCYHGLFLVLERAVLGKVLARLPRALSGSYAFIVILFSWVIFRSDNLTEARTFIEQMFAVFRSDLRYSPPRFVEVMSNRAVVVLAISALCAFFPESWREKLFAQRASFARPVPVVLYGTCSLLLFFLATLSLVNSQFHPFIYFRF